MEDNKKQIAQRNSDALQNLLQRIRSMANGRTAIQLSVQEEDNDGNDELECLGIPTFALNRDEQGYRIFTNLIEKDTVFGNLPRRVALPVSECPFTITKKHYTQELITKLWNGDFIFEIPKPIPKTEEDELAIFFTSETSEDISSYGGIKFFFLERGEATFQGAFLGGDPLGRYLDKGQQDLLIARVLHHILRQYGWMLPWLFLENLLGVVCTIWSQSKKYKKLILDCRIILTDLVCNIPSEECSESLASAKFDIAEALDALGRFEESEILCIETAEACEVTPIEARAYLCAAGSCKRDVRYDASLSHLLNALRIMTHISGSLDWRCGDANAAISNLLLLHHQIALDEKDGNYNGTGFHAWGCKEKQVLFASLSSLLAFAKFEPATDRSNSREVLRCLQGAGSISKELKPTYHKQNKAKQLLLRAFRSENVERYKETVLGAMKGGDKAFQLNSRSQIAADDHDRRVEEKREATYQLKNQCGKFCRYCANCDMQEPRNERFKDCQCHLVSFCSKECQVENWKSHKRTCPWHAEQKKNLKNKG